MPFPAPSDPPGLRRSGRRPPRLSLGPNGGVRRIVVPVVADTGHDRGIEVARAWARHWGLPMVLLSVDTTARPGDRPDEAAAGHLTRTRERLADGGLEVTAEILAGPNVTAGVAERLAEGDLLVMGSAGATGSPITSHGWQLVQRWRGPTLLVGPHVAPGPPEGPVVTGLDGSPLAEQALAGAAGLAAALGTRLWLVQAAPSAVVEQVEHLRHGGQDVSTSAYLRSVAGGLTGSGWQAGGPAAGGPTVGGLQLGCEVGWELIQSDDGAGALVDFARDRSASALVLTTHGRSGLRAEALGSTCLAVVAGAGVPVLVSVPDGPDQAALAS